MRSEAGPNAAACLKPKQRTFFNPSVLRSHWLS